MKQLAVVLLLAGCVWGQKIETGKVIPFGGGGSGTVTMLCDTDKATADGRLYCQPDEPMDVPAIINKLLAHHKGECWGTDNLMIVCATEDDYKDAPTCADKRRVLLTSEDGKKHCVLFPSSGRCQ